MQTNTYVPSAKTLEQYWEMYHNLIADIKAFNSEVSRFRKVLDKYYELINESQIYTNKKILNDQIQSVYEEINIYDRMVNQYLTLRNDGYTLLVNNTGPTSGTIDRKLLSIQKLMKAKEMVPKINSEREKVKDQFGTLGELMRVYHK